MSWLTEFGREYQVPKAIVETVDARYIQDTSHKYDAAPSFSAPLKSGRWLRLWVEHPDIKMRRGGPHRFRLEVTRSLREEGREWIVSDELHEVLPYMLQAIQDEGFHLTGRRRG